MIVLGNLGNLDYFLQDSLFYIHQPGLPEPPLGDCLGDLANSLEPGEYIVEMASLGEHEMHEHMVRQ